MVPNGCVGFTRIEHLLASDARPLRVQVPPQPPYSHSEGQSYFTSNEKKYSDRLFLGILFF